MLETNCHNTTDGDSIPPTATALKTALLKPFSHFAPSVSASVHNLPTKVTPNPIEAPFTPPPVRPDVWCDSCGRGKPEIQEAEACPHCGDLYFATDPEASFCPWCHVWLCSHHCCDRHSQVCDGNSAHPVISEDVETRVTPRILPSELGEIKYRLGTVYESNRICQNLIRELLEQLAQYEGGK